MDKSIRSAPTVARVRLGVERGLRIALVFGGIALVMNLFLKGAAYERFGLSAGGATAAYLIGGIAGGAIVGVLLPVIHDSYSAGLVAAAGFLPFTLLIRIARSGWGGWTSAEPFGVCAIALIMGAVWGPIIWRARSAEDKS